MELNEDPFYLALLLLSFSRQRPVTFWGLHRLHLQTDLRHSLTTFFTLLIPILALLALGSGMYWALGWPLEPQPALLRFMEARDSKTLAPFLFYALIIAPAWEELFFRGTLFPWLSSRLPVTQAHWLSALAFGAVHLHGPTFIPLTCLGAVLVGLYRNSQSLIPSFLLHSLFNANTCILLLLARPPLPP
ncbi:MAG: CPBP family intramembrane metalloprotease [Verrucomicrobia bacterium]|nr:CPBP family intramembrane metalloprotease [Verrucomicrobiota bacterium]